MKNNWVWMPHAGHCIIGNQCRFHLTTKVGKYLVSTIGEYLPDSQVREIIAKSRNIILEGQGDYRESSFLRKNGYEDVGHKRKFETMVFKIKKSKNKCCPFEMNSPDALDFDAYNDAGKAHEGHLKMCRKYDALAVRSNEKGGGK